MVTIVFKDLELIGYHGLYPEETILGNVFIFNANIEYNSNLAFAQDNNFFYLDYVQVFDFIQAFWQTPYPLLEKLLHDLAQQLYYKFPEITKIQLEVYKKNLYLPKFKGQIGIKYNKSF